MKNEDIIKVPLLGKITAGSPITAIEQPNEFFDLPASLIPAKAEVFTLHVSGESMINVGIFDGDIVFVMYTFDLVCSNEFDIKRNITIIMENQMEQIIM